MTIPIVSEVVEESGQGGVPFFSVIIPTCNRNGMLECCLVRLAPGAQELVSGQYEVIVADDSSRGEARGVTLEKYPWAKWVRGHGRGPAANRNNGATHARGSWLVFLDDDCLPDPALLSAYAEAIARCPATQVFEGRIYSDRPRKSLAETAPINEQGGHLWSCNFSLKKTLFDSMGGFDERFPYPAMEDVDFRLRLRQRAEQFVFLPQAAVCHPWETRSMLKAVARSEASLRVYLSIHPEEQADFTLSKLLVQNLRAFVKETLPGLLRFRGRGFLQAMIWHACMIRQAWRARRRGLH